MITTYNYKTKYISDTYSHPIKSSNDEYKINRFNETIDKETGKVKNVSEAFDTNRGQYLIANELTYFDIETVRYFDKIEKKQRFEEKDTKALNTDMNNLYQFSLFTVDSLEQEKLLQGLYEVLIFFGIRNNCRKNRKLEYLEKNPYQIFNENKHNEMIYHISYSNGGMFINIHCLLPNDTITFLDFLTQYSILNWVGFNSNRFDTLIFKHIGYKRKLNKRQNSMTIEKKIIGKKTIKRKTVYDILEISKSYGLRNLKKVGDFLKCPKLEHSGEDFESSVDYNNADVLIPFLFVNYLNEQGVGYNNFPTFVRKKFILDMFIKTSTKYIHSDKKFNRFDLIGGKTENYIWWVEDPYYYDMNSLYTSSRTRLKVSGYFIDGDNLRFKLRTLRTSEYSNFKDTIRRFYDLIMIDYDKFNYNYLTMSELFETFFGDKTYLGFFKIKGYREDLPENVKNKLDFYFPYSYKNKFDRRLFQFKKGGKYQITYYEIMFLCFFDYEIVELYETPLMEDILKEELENYYNERLKIKREMSKVEKQLKEDIENETLEITLSNLNSQQLYIKLLINAGYGIFGTSNLKNEEIDMNILDNIEEEQLKKERQIEELNKKIGEEEVKEVVNEKLITKYQKEIDKIISQKENYLLQKDILEDRKYGEVLKWEKEISKLDKDKDKEEIKKIRKDKINPIIEKMTSFFKTYHYTNEVETFKIFKQGDRFYKQSYQYTKKYTDNSIPPLAISITSNSRFVMFCNIFLNNILCEGEDKHISYTDTDSAFISKWFLDRLEEDYKDNYNFIGEELGQMGNEMKEGWEIKLSINLAPKSYYYFYTDGEKWKYKFVVKGTGDEYFVKDTVINNVSFGFRPIDIKTSFSRDTQQKRTLIGNEYINKETDSSYDWKSLYLYSSLVSYMIRSFIDMNEFSLDMVEDIKTFCKDKCNEILSVNKQNDNINYELDTFKYIRLNQLEKIGYKKKVG